VTIDPRVILLKQFSAVFASTQEDLFATRVNLRILCNIIDPTLIDGPTVLLLVVLSDLFSRVDVLIWILDLGWHPKRRHQELPLRLPILHRYFHPLNLVVDTFLDLASVFMF
jgi:hypothetical protein